MLTLKLATQSIKKNREVYGPFLLASAALIGIYYLFSVLLSDQGVARISELGNAMKGVLQVGAVFSALITLGFMLYTNGIIAKARTRELGLYNMLGMTKANLFALIVAVDLILFGSSLVLGMVVGVSFIKFAFLGIAKLMGVSTPTIAPLAGTPILETTFFFAAVYLALLIFDLFKLRGVKPIDLWQSAKQGEKKPKKSWVTVIGGIISLVFIATGYHMSLTTKPSVSVIQTFLAAVVLVVIGTYGLFTAASVLGLTALKKNKAFYYKPNHFITVSGMLHRVKQNGLGLASICLLCTSAIVAMVATTSLMVGRDNTLNAQYPYDVQVSEALSAKQQTTLFRLAKQNHVKISDLTSYNAVEMPVDQSQNNFNFAHDATVNTYVTVVPISTYNQLENKHVTLANNQVLLAGATSSHRFGKVVTLNKQKFTATSVPAARKIPNTSVQSIVLVMKSAKQINSLSKSSKLGSQTAFNVQGSLANQRKFNRQIQHVIRAFFNFRLETADNLNQLYGGLVFIGVILSVTMLLATAMIIYYKQVAEGYADQARFKAMQQIGLSKQETKQAINSQVLMVFMYPLLVATIHLGFALPILNSVLKLFEMNNWQVLLETAGIMLAVTVGIYLVIYGLTTRVYRRIVNAPIKKGGI